MRQVGSLPNEQHAQLFTDYLVTQGISAQAEQEDGRWVIWVRDENHVETAAETLETFEENPSDERYRDATNCAETIREEEFRGRAAARKNVIDVRTQWGQGLARRAPLVSVLIGLSVLVTIVTNRGKHMEPVLAHLTICDFEPAESGMVRYSSDYLKQIKEGQVWRTVTPIFIHFGIIHLLFNMYILYYFGSQIESRRRTPSFAVLVLILAVTSNVAQAYLAQNFPSDVFGRSPKFGGMSGVNYGLFGYVWMKTLYDPSSGLQVSRFTVFMLLFWFLICFMPSMPVANGAHGVGLGVGMAIGYAPEFLKTLKRR